MREHEINCPKCGARIQITEALTSQIESSVKARFEAEARAREREMQVRLDEIGNKAKALERERESLAERVAEQVKAERSKIAEEEKARVVAEQAEATKALRAELEEKSRKIAEAGKRELDILKKQRELEEKSEQLELQVERRMAEERRRVSQEAVKRAAEENMLKMREKDDQLAAMKKQIDELKRKSEVGSQEAQGEALEGELQEVLERSFPLDIFEEVKKGARGADVVQKVRNNNGKICGSILWESKNTKDFQKGWIEKVKKDQRENGSEVAVIMTMALPKEVEGFGLYEDVWVTNYQLAVSLCTVLRQGLVNVQRERVVAAGQDSVKEIVYRYVTGQEFAMQVQAVVDAYSTMQSDLESEKRSMQRIWKKREKQITSVLENVTGICGSIEGLVGGKALPAIRPLSLEAIAEDE